MVVVILAIECVERKWQRYLSAMRQFLVLVSLMRRLPYSASLLRHMSEPPARNTLNYWNDQSQKERGPCTIQYSVETKCVQKSSLGITACRNVRF